MFRSCRSDYWITDNLHVDPFVNRMSSYEFSFLSLPLLRSQLIKRRDSSVGVHNEIGKLVATLKMLEAVLNEAAEEKQVKDRAVKIWLEELKDVVYA
ncbi:hypothetical protein IFM89_026226 [Coptis chinensis]|uniref:Disease resistance N-terminal domain-containing protein n=1 Tax=Coptis chinensis TaxID=261450 RepID=A0A835M1R0_9MAGN|nr:hypothetical protein IFM89_026226 [Coptis chinensis]